MIIVPKIKLSKKQGTELRRPEMKFLVGGCEGCGSGKKKICCAPSGGECHPEMEADSCDGSPCGDGVSFNCG